MDKIAREGLTYDDVLLIPRQASTLPRERSPLARARRWGRGNMTSAAIARRTGLPQDSVRDLMLAERWRRAEKTTGRTFRPEELTARLRARVQGAMPRLSIFRRAA